MLRGLRARARSLWRGLSRRDTIESEMAEEFRHHLELRADDLIERGLSPEQARRRARIEFGHAELFMDEARASRGLRPLDEIWFSMLDLKIGVRMLVKYPGLTIVGGLALAFGICAGVGGFEVRTQMFAPSLPLEDGRRLVGIQNWDASKARPDRRSLHDLAIWRQELDAIVDIGAFREVGTNLISDEGMEPITVAEVTASVFRVARVAPLLGRVLAAADEVAGAPSVVIIGHELWRSRFDGDPDVIGRTVRLGTEESTVVGVMPEGFAFPIWHSLWAPLRLSELDWERGSGPEISVFGRLADGTTMERAQSELQALGARIADSSPSTPEHIRPRLLPYAASVFDLSGFWLGSLLANVFLVMLLALVCANVALLLFARATTRENEMAVRSALGAGRGRILVQLFIEALVLAVAAVAVGLVATRLALRSYWSMFEADSGPLPFWFTDRLTPSTVLYAALLTVLGAVIAGVLPALKVTGRGGHARLREATAGGGGVRFGGLWTLVITSQIAATVAFPAAALFMHRWVVQGQNRDVGFPAQQYISARLEVAIDPVEAELEQVTRLRHTYDELRRRLVEEPEVAATTLAGRLPGTLHPRLWLEVDGETIEEGSRAPRWARAASIDVDFFAALGAPIVAGRAFSAADAASEQPVVIVNELFAERVLGGRQPIGRRIRRASDDSARAEPWYEIVGLVPDLGTVGDQTDPGVYYALKSTPPSSVYLIAHVRTDPGSFAPRLRALAAEVDPDLQLHDVMPLDEVGAELWLESQYLSRLLAVLSSIALLLSLAAIYSVMAYTVSRRTREIGLRVALGAGALRVIAVIFRRPLLQVAAGVVAGTVLVAALSRGVLGGAMSLSDAALIVTYAVLMLAVCLLACIVPTHRALRVEPMEALSVDG